MKRTYNEYLQSLKKDIYAETGERITCLNGHYIMSFTHTIYCGETPIALDFDEVSDIQTKGASSLPTPFQCVECLAPLVRVINKQNAYGDGVQFFIGREWREKKYD